MMFIRKLIWDTRNTTHIAKHNVIPEEVEEVFYQQPIVQHSKINNRLVILGCTFDSRYLNVVIENKGKGIYYIVTAYDASTQDKTLFQRLKGGENK